MPLQRRLVPVKYTVRVSWSAKDWITLNVYRNTLDEDTTILSIAPHGPIAARNNSRSFDSAYPHVRLATIGAPNALRSG
jgi:hypothetical protein